MALRCIALAVARRARHRRLRRLANTGPRRRANRSGDAFSQALMLANDGKNDEALAALEQLEKDGYGAYPLLARMRAATVLADKGDFAGAVAGFDEVAADTSIPGRSATWRGCARRLSSSTTAPMPTSRPRRAADRRHQHAAPLGARGARPVRLEGRQAPGCAQAVRPDRRGRRRPAQRPPARDLDVRTDPRFGRRVVTDG